MEITAETNPQAANPALRLRTPDHLQEIGPLIWRLVQVRDNLHLSRLRRLDR
jgi:hypothetical protein